MIDSILAKSSISNSTKSADCGFKKNMYVSMYLFRKERFWPFLQPSINALLLSSRNELVNYDALKPDDLVT